MRRVGLLLATGLLATGCTTSTAIQLRAGDPAAEPGGALRVALTEPGSIDPGNVYEPAGELIARTLCTPLLGTDPETSELLPSIATSYLVSDGGTSISLRLRDDVVFSDGTPLTARDVAFTLSRVASADYASTSAERLSPIDGYAQIHADVPTDQDVERQRLRGVSVRDDQNIQIQLTEPLSDFVRVLGSPLLSPVSEKAARADPEAFARQPVCVGPYQLEKPYTAGDDTLRLVRSSAYTPVDTARTRGGVSYADSIDIRIYDDAAGAAAAVVAGQADVAPARPTDTASVKVGAGPAVEYLGLPTSVPAFQDFRLRQAVALSIDREELVRRVFPGTRVAAHGFLPQTSEADDRCALLPSRGNLAQAQTLLSEAGTDLRGVRVPFYFNNELRNGALVREIARQLRAGIGLTAIPVPLTFQDYLTKASSTQGFDGLFRFSWSVPYADVDGYLHPLFSSDRIGRDNLSRFSDPGVDRALDRVAREADDDVDRALGYKQVTDRLCEQLPMVPLTTALSRWLVADTVGAAGGQYVDGSTGQVLLRELYLR